MKNRKSTQTLRISILLYLNCVYIIRKQKQQAASQQYFTVILSDIYTNSHLSTRNYKPFYYSGSVDFYEYVYQQDIDFYN